jgi:hypothetical protein
MTVVTKWANIKPCVVPSPVQRDYMVNLQDIGLLPAAPAAPVIEGANLPPFAGGDLPHDTQRPAPPVVSPHLVNDASASFGVAILPSVLPTVAAAAGGDCENLPTTMAFEL